MAVFTANARFELLDAAEVGIILSLNRTREALRANDATRLPFSAVQESSARSVQLIAFRFVAANTKIEFNFDFVTPHAQILEMCSQKRYMWRMAILQGVFRRNLCHHAICGDHVQDVQSFQHRGRERHPAMILQTTIARNVRVAGLEGDEPFETVVFGTLKEMAAAQVIQTHRGLTVNFPIHGLFQMAAEYTGFRVILVPFLFGCGRFRHCRHDLSSSQSSLFFTL